MQKRCLLILGLALIVALPASACIWDRDTLAMEKARFPEVVELIAGYFPRHSESYYHWRLEQVRSIPAGQRTAADFDDLGASYDKLGQHQKAIDTMLAKIEYFPSEGVYETHANLGTFYIHNGELEKGAQYIGSAIQINPDAHFGREVYQKLVVQYVLQQRAAGNTLPLNPFGNTGGFAEFVSKDFSQDANPFAEGNEYDEQQAAIDAEYKRAIKGILGMMRFGNYDSPILLEVLGDLLRTQSEDDHGVQRLASRAYLKASYEVDNLEAVKQYRTKAETALSMQQGVQLTDIEAELTKEIAEGDAYFAQIKADEDAWIEAGKDVDVQFVSKYYNSELRFEEGLLESINAKYSTLDPVQRAFVSLGIGVLLLLLMIGGVAYWYTRKRRRSGAA